MPLQSSEEGNNVALPFNGRKTSQHTVKQ